MSESTSVDSREKSSQPAMFIGLDFINGKEFKNSIEMHQGEGIEIIQKPNDKDTVITKEGLEYYIRRWKDSIEYWEEKIKTASEEDKKELRDIIEKYQKNITVAQNELDKLLGKDNLR